MNLRERLSRVFRVNNIHVNFGIDAPAQVLNYTAKQLYQTQDNLQAVVNFLSNSIAQLPLKVYKRNGENNRTRDRDSPAALLIASPNRYQTTFEFVRALSIEYFVFGAVYIWITPSAETDSGWELFLIPAEWIRTSGKPGSNPYEADSIVVSIANGESFEIPSSEFTMYRMYSAGNPGGYISSISALKQTLQEQIEAGNFRKELWHSSGRLNAQIIRPANVQQWTDETRKKFVEAFRESWGAGGSKAGSIPLLEDGMKIEPFQTSFKESQWAESVKLSRETVAAAYGINPSLIWHTDSQTYASAKDNARQLYAECLGPILQMLQQRINRFIFPKIGADKNTYVEFDLNEKMKGSFEERASILQTAVGGPWMTRNEARADNNLPPVEGGDELIVPLNVSEGSVSDSEDVSEIEESEKNAVFNFSERKSKIINIKSKSTDEEDKTVADVIAKFIKRQSRSVLPKISSTDEWWDSDRWNKELADDLEPFIKEISDTHGSEVSKKLGEIYNDKITRNYVRKISESKAKGINESTRSKIENDIELGEESNPAKVFENRESKSLTIGRAVATAAATFGTNESVEQAHSTGKFPIITKTWVTGENARESHEAMNGETVPFEGNFSNGARWVGDDNLSADESCGCNCSIEINVEV